MGNATALKIIQRDLTEEELWLHDLHNKCHGVKLYLQNSLQSEKNLQGPEIQLILSEIQSIENQLTNRRFQIHGEKKLIKISALQDTLSSSSKLFLANFEVEWKSQIEGEGFLLDSIVITSEEWLSFLRFMDNLLKNISDHSEGGVQLHVSWKKIVQNHETSFWNLKFQSFNNFNTKKKHFGQQDMKSQIRGLGQYSMKSLIHQLGGQHYSTIHHIHPSMKEKSGYAIWENFLDLTFKVSP